MLSPSVCWLPLPRGSSSGGERAFLWGDGRTFGQFLFFPSFLRRGTQGFSPWPSSCKIAVCEVIVRTGIVPAVARACQRKFRPFPFVFSSFENEQPRRERASGGKA